METLRKTTVKKKKTVCKLNDLKDKQSQKQVQISL